MSHKVRFSQQDSTIAYLIVLTVLLLGILAGTHWYFLERIHYLSHQKTLLESRQILLEKIAKTFDEVHTLSSTLPSIAFTHLQQKEYAKISQKKLQSLYMGLRLCQEGGTFEIRLPLNLPNQRIFREKLTVEPFRPDAVRPLFGALSLLKKERKHSHQMVADMNEKHLATLNLDGFLQLRSRYAQHNKQMMAHFRRIDEKINRLFAINRSQLNQATQELNRNEKLFRTITLVMSLLFLGSVSALSLWIIRRIVHLNRSLEERLYHDELTGLKSRLALEETRLGTHSIVYMVDLDDFSGINSLYGTQAGDRLLQAVARRLREHCSICALHRFGGDIFALTHPDLRTTGMSIKKRITFIEHLLENEPFPINDEALKIGITLGIGVGSEAVTHAMIALDTAKEEKKAYKIYSRRNGHTQKIQEHRYWIQTLTLAIEEERICAFAQPIVDANGYISHYECLMRLEEHDDFGSIRYTPPIFLDMAKKVKLYPLLSRLMIRKAFEKCSLDGSFSINLSYLDIQEPGMRLFLDDLIDRHNAAGRVMFEILEQESLENFELVEAFVEHFRTRGVEIAIDDYGSDYSNLMEVIRLQPDYLKIDGSLIRDITTSHVAYLAVRSIVDFAHELGVKTVAEFVEDEKTFQICQSLGIDRFQGYYFSPPVQEITSLQKDKQGFLIPAG